MMLHYHGQILAFLSALSIAFIPNLAKVVYEADVGITAVLVFRSLVMLILLSPILFYRHTINVKFAIVSGFAFLGMSVGYVGGGKYMDVGLVTLIYFSHPILVMLWQNFDNKTPINLYTVCTIVSVVIGLYFVVGVNTDNITLMGLSFAVLASISCTIMIRSNARQITTGMSPIWVNYQMVVVSTIVLLIFSIGTNIQILPNQPVHIMGILVLIGVCFTVGLMSFFVAFRHISAVQATFITLLQPVFVILIDYILFGTILSPIQYIGGICIIGAIVLSELGKSQ